MKTPLRFTTQTPVGLGMVQMTAAFHPEQVNPGQLSYCFVASGIRVYQEVKVNELRELAKQITAVADFYETEVVPALEARPVILAA